MRGGGMVRIRTGCQNPGDWEGRLLFTEAAAAACSLSLAIWPRGPGVVGSGTGELRWSGDGKL